MTSAPALVFVHDSAAASITNQTLSNGVCTICIYGVTNSPYVVEATTNLAARMANWIPIETNYVTFDFTTYITNAPRQFFRIRYAP